MEIGYAGIETQLRVLRHRPSAGVGRRQDLFFRMHILHRVHRGTAESQMPELRR